MEAIYNFNIGVGVLDFEHILGRMPESEEEFNEFGRLCEKALGHSTDWSIIFDCVKDEWKDAEQEAQVKEIIV